MTIINVEDDNLILKPLLARSNKEFVLADDDEFRVCLISEFGELTSALN